MKATKLLHDLGQSLWLDNITRDLLESGTLKHYIDELSVTGLTSNPTIFEQAIKNSSAYDADIRRLLKEGKSEEQVFFELALEDLTRAADLFRPIYDRTNGVDGWGSLEVSPLLAHDTPRPVGAPTSPPRPGPGPAWHCPCRQEPARACGPPESIHQDSGDQRRSARDRRSDFRRRAYQCHVVVFPRTLRSRGRGFLAGHRATDR